METSSTTVANTITAITEEIVPANWLTDIGSKIDDIQVDVTQWRPIRRVVLQRFWSDAAELVMEIMGKVLPRANCQVKKLPDDMPEVCFYSEPVRIQGKGLEYVDADNLTDIISQLLGEAIRLLLEEGDKVSWWELSEQEVT